MVIQCGRIDKMENASKQLGYIGLGKMGLNMVLRLLEKGYDVLVYDENKEVISEMGSRGAVATSRVSDLVTKVASARTIWLMVPHTAIDAVLNELMPSLQKGDTVIDGGNSFYKDSMRRAKELKAKGVNFLDVGISGGPSGAREGACLMVGGSEEIYKQYEQLFKDLAADQGYGYMGVSGAGHFVKMVHNGIEYGMMQALAEGFAIMKESDFKLDLEKISGLYNHKSVIESRLVGWLKDAFTEYGRELDGVSGSVGHTGEAAWTIEAAKELDVPVSVIERALEFRRESEKNPSYTGKILSALRNQFGGHDIKK